MKANDAPPQLVRIRLLGFVAVILGAIVSYVLAQAGQSALASSVATAVAWYAGKLTAEPLREVTLHAITRIPPPLVEQAISRKPPPP